MGQAPRWTRTACLKPPSNSKIPAISGASIRLLRIGLPSANPSLTRPPAANPSRSPFPRLTRAETSVADKSGNGADLPPVSQSAPVLQDDPVGQLVGDFHQQMEKMLFDAAGAAVREKASFHPGRRSPRSSRGSKACAGRSRFRPNRSLDRAISQATEQGQPGDREDPSRRLVQEA